jgi:YD repeat-containing protein
MSPFNHHFLPAGLIFVLASLVPFAGAQTYSYDNAGRLTTAAYPDGSGVRYTYDASGNLTGVSALTIPAAPAAPTIAATNPSAADLSWASVSSASNGYTVQRRSAETDTWTTIAQVPAGQITFTDAGIPAGAGVLYRLQAIGGGSSAFSAVAVAPAIVGAAVARLVNISTRARVGADSDVLIAGFHIAGTEPRPVVIRAVGPALLAVDPNFPNPLADPVLEIFDGSSRSVIRNDNWSDGGAAGALTRAFAGVGAFPFPAGSRDAAVRLSLDPGDYTAVIRGAGGTTGPALAGV